MPDRMNSIPSCRIQFHSAIAVPRYRIFSMLESMLLIVSCVLFGSAGLSFFLVFNERIKYGTYLRENHHDLWKAKTQEEWPTGFPARLDSGGWNLKWIHKSINQPGFVDDPKVEVFQLGIKRGIQRTGILLLGAISYTIGVLWYIGEL